MEEYQVVELESDSQVKVDVRDLFRCILRNLIPIIVITIIFGIIGVGLAQYKRTTSYTAKMTMIVNSPNGIDQPGTPAKTQAQSVQAVLNNPKIMLPVYHNMPLKTKKRLIKKAKVKEDPDDTSGSYTHILKLSIRGNSERQVKRDIRRVAAGAEKVLTQNLNTVSSVEVGDMKVSSKTSPSRKKYGGGAAAVGLVLSLLYVIFKFLNDNTYRSETLLEEDTKWPVLGTIPAADAAEKLSPKGGKN